MGFKVSIGPHIFEATEFSVDEAATPKAAGDSSGQVGTIRVTIPVPDPFVQADHPLAMFGPGILANQEVRVLDTRQGFTLGKVSGVQKNVGGATYTVTAISRLGDLNVYNVQSQPFVGTLLDAFTNYLALANITTDFLVDPDIATRPVVFPGWNGELWYNLKLMAAAMDCDISLVSGVILLRPTGKRVATRGRDIDRTVSTGGGNLAQFIDVYQYNNRPISGELVYPPGGWSESVTVLHVNSGESVSEPLQLSASVSSVVQPEMRTFVSRPERNASVFTVVGDDGLPIDPVAWRQFGGSLRVEINPDTTSLTVHITAPSGLPNKDGSEIGVYGIALSSESNTGRYSTLRILGSGVAYDKTVRRFATGISERQTATEVGVTIDNPFLGTIEEVNRTAAWAVAAYNGLAMSINGTVVSVNKRGDSGSATYQTWRYDQDLFPGGTYASVQAARAGKTYRQVMDELNASVEDDFDNQVFGNVNGARIWDATLQRWFRIRTGSVTPNQVTFSADNDMMYRDVDVFTSGKTWRDMQNLRGAYTYRQAEIMGVVGV